MKQSSLVLFLCIILNLLSFSNGRLGPEKRQFITNVEISDSYLRDHRMPVMPLLEEESQKRTRLKEKELTFYGHLKNDDSLSESRFSKHSNVKSNEKNGKKKDGSTKPEYGSEENPAKSCKDIFSKNSDAKSGNYTIRTSDDEILMVFCNKSNFSSNSTHSNETTHSAEPDEIKDLSTKNKTKEEPSEEEKEKFSKEVSKEEHAKVVPGNPEPPHTTPGPTSSEHHTTGHSTPTTKPLPTSPTTSATTKPLGGGKPQSIEPSKQQQPEPTGPTNSQLPTTTINPKLAGRVTKEQYNNFEQEKLDNPYFPDFPASNPNSHPPPPHYSDRPPVDQKEGARPLERPPYPPPPPRRPTPYDNDQRRPPPPVLGYGSRPQRPPFPSQSRAPYDRERYRPPEDGYKDSSYRQHPSPSEGRYPRPPPSRYDDRYRGHLNEEHLDFDHDKAEGGQTSAANQKGKAGDLGDTPVDQNKMKTSSNAVPDTLYGRRDTRPKLSINKVANDTVDKPVARSVTWAFHEKVMEEEHKFKQQYDDFETMDEAINLKRRNKTLFHGPSKAVQVKANVRSWSNNQKEIMQKVAKEQYEDFEKTNMQIAQDMASKQYREQYDGFEAFKNATTQQNETESNNQTDSTNNPGEKFTNEPQKVENPTNPLEATNTRQPENNQQPALTPTTTNEQPSLVATQQQNNAVNNTVPNQNTTKPTETDEYKQYVIDSMPEDAFPDFPNATSQKSVLANDTNALIKEPIEPSIVSNASYGFKSENSSTLNSSITAIPIQILNKTFPIVNNMTLPNGTTPLVNSVSNQTNNVTTTRNDLAKPVPTLSIDTMAMKRGETVYPEDDLISKLLAIKDELVKEKEAGHRRHSLGLHHHERSHKLRQLSGPPNYALQKRISSLPTQAMQRALVSYHHLTGVKKHLELKNLTGKVDLEDEGSPHSKIVDEGEAPQEVGAEDHEDGNNAIIEMVKNGAISLEEKDSKDFLEYLTKALKNNKKSEDSGMTRTQRHKTIANPYNFVVPETKKFTLEGGELNEERLMEILGERAISAKHKQRELEQRKRISQIKNQALSKRIPLIGHFSTSQLKEFSFKTQEDEDAESEFLKSLEPIAKMISKNGTSLFEKMEHGFLSKKGERVTQLRDALSNFVKNNHMLNERGHKRQSLKHINRPLFTAQQNMADLIKIWQNTMDDVPGLTDENRKIDEKSGTANETIQKIKEEQKGVKEKVKEIVDKEEKEQKQKTNQVVQDNQPGRRRDSVDDDHVHQVFSTVKTGIDKLRHKLKTKLWNKLWDEKHMHDDDWDFKGNIPKYPKQGVEIKDMLNEEMESVVQGQQNISKKMDRVWENTISQFPKNSSVLVKENKDSDSDSEKKSSTPALEEVGESFVSRLVRGKDVDDEVSGSGSGGSGWKKDLVSDTQQKILKEQERIQKMADRVVHKAQKDHKDYVDRVLKQPSPQPQQYVEHLNAESLPGMDKRSNITTPTHKPFKFQQKMKKTLQALKTSLRLFEEERRRHPTYTMTFLKERIKEALRRKIKHDIVKFAKRDDAGVGLTGEFPEKKNVLQIKPLGKPYPIEGTTLGSRARAFRKASLRKRVSSPSRRISKRDQHNSLRGLIPSAIGDMQPSNEKSILSPTSPAVEVLREKEKISNIGHNNNSAPSGSSNGILNGQTESVLARPWDESSLHALQQLQNDYNNLKMKLQQQQKQQQSQKPDISVGETGTSPADEETPPVGPDGKPYPNSGPQQDDRKEEDKKGDEAKQQENSPNHPGESGKDELGSHLITKLQKAGTGGLQKPTTDNTFEAGLSDGIEEQVEKQINKQPNDQGKQVTGTTADQQAKNDSNSQQVQDPQPAQRPEDHKQEESQLQMLPQDNGNNFTQPVNVTALELGIIKLLNDSSRSPHAKTKHGQKMEELNMKYEALKLPIENGEFWPIPENQSKGKKKLRNDAKDREKAGNNDDTTEEEMPQIVDATPTEAAPPTTGDYLTQRLKLMELSALLSANNKPNTTTPEQDPAATPVDLKLDTPESNMDGNDMTTKASTDPSDEMTIQLQPPSLPATSTEALATNDANNTTNIEQPPTPAELAKKLADHLNPNQGQMNNIQPTSQPVTPHQIQHTSKPDNAQPVIPIPMDSQLGKLLYPKPDDRVSHNTSTSMVFDGSQERISTSVDGTNYSSILIDQTKQLLDKNKIKRKDLFDLLQSSHVLDNLQAVFPNENTNNLIESLNVQAGLRSQVIGKKNTAPINGNIHITVQKKGGEFYLIPNSNEAYQKHLVPQEVGLKPVPAKKKV
eukprot:TCONS_00013168-protein